MANIRTCDHAWPERCKMMGEIGKGKALRRVSVTIYTKPTKKNPFSCCTVMRDLCPEHAPAAGEWAQRVGGQADFSDLDGSGIDAASEPPDEPS